MSSNALMPAAVNPSPSQSTSKTSQSSPQAQAQLPQFLQGRFPRILNDCRVRTSDRGSSVTRRHPQHREYDFLAWLNICGVGTKDEITGRRKVGALL